MMKVFFDTLKKLLPQKLNCYFSSSEIVLSFNIVIKCKLKIHGPLTIIC